MPRCHEPASEPAPSVPSASVQRSGPRRVVVISASVGAGPDGAAAGLADQLIAHGFLVDRYDFMHLLPAGVGRLLCDGYRRLLTWVPPGYQRLYSQRRQRLR